MAPAGVDGNLGKTKCFGCVWGGGGGVQDCTLDTCKWITLYYVEISEITFISHTK